MIILLHPLGGVQIIAMSVSVCLSIYLWPWLGSLLTTVQYVTCFRLWMMSCFGIIGPVGQNQRQCFISSSLPGKKVKVTAISGHTVCCL